MQQFKLFKNPNSWLLMQYKHHCMDLEWLPKKDGGIWLWKEDNEGKPILSNREPNALLLQQM